MTSEARVAVIIPCFRQARWVGAAVDSALEGQGVGVEVLVVDDGSDDDVAGALGRRLDRPDVRLVRQDNAGVAAARNAGIAATAAPYVQLLDADDLLEPGKLRAQTTVLDADPAIGACWCAHLHLDDETGERRPADPPFAGSPANDPVDALWAPWKAPPAAFLVRRSWLARVGGFRAEHAPSEDMDFWLRLAGAGCRFAWQPEPLVLYRRHATSITATLASSVLQGARTRLAFSRAHPEPAAAASETVLARAVAELDAQVAELDGARARERELQACIDRTQAALDALRMT